MEKPRSSLLRTQSISGKADTAKNPLVEVGSILVFTMSIFVLVALFTYRPEDPSFFTSSDGAVQNACGRVGAYLAALVLQWVGMGAFLLPAALFFISAVILKREGSLRLVGTLGGMVVAVMSFTVFLTLQWKYWPYAGTLLLTGGAFGAWISEILVRQFNPVGSSIVSLLVFCLALALSTPLSIARIGARVIRAVSAFCWKLARIAGTYLLYLMGLLAMRLAHAAGDFMQRLIESAMRRARAKKLAKEKAEAITIGPNGPETEAKVAADDKTALPAPSPDIVRDLGMEDPDEEAEAVLSTSEAPNVLPELDETAIAAPDPKSPKQMAMKPVMAVIEAPKPKKVEKEEKPPRRAMRRGQWKLPTIDFLRKVPKVESKVDEDKLRKNAALLVQKFADFGIDGEVTAVRPGPVITLYEFKPGPGIKVSKIASYADDLSMALSARSVRILAPLPGKSVVGIEIPSEQREVVYLREFLGHQDFHSSRYLLPVAMGKDIGGQTVISDLCRMPHLLVAGQTGSGKSVFVNGLICSLLYRFTPEELRMILVDPKTIEFQPYHHIPHLLLPVVEDANHASTSLRWAVREMERRYRILAKAGVRNLTSFNQKVEEVGADVMHDLLFGEEQFDENAEQDHSPKVAGSDWYESFEPDVDGTPKVSKLPYIVIIIDELADLMMVAKKDVEYSIARIAQKARAAGIHLVVATQRPSTDVITGLIKANLPSRMSFQLASQIDSRTIMDKAGAEKLLGQGDMLFVPPGTAQIVRLHGAFVDDDEINKVTAFLKAQGEPAYREDILVEESEEDADGEGGSEEDELFDEAIEIVRNAGQASASFLQRRLQIGYNRAARMIENMEARGIVGPAEGSKPREVLMR